MRSLRQNRLIWSLQYYYSAPNRQPEVIQVMLSLFRRSLSLLSGLSRGNTVDKRLFPSLNQSKMLIIEIKQDTSFSMALASFLSSSNVVFAESILLNC